MVAGREAGSSNQGAASRRASDCTTTSEMPVFAAGRTLILRSRDSNAGRWWAASSDLHTLVAQHLPGQNRVVGQFDVVAGFRSGKGPGSGRILPHGIQARG